MAVLRIVYDPWGGMSQAVQSQRWVLPLAVLALAVALAGGARALRWQAGPAVIAELTASGELTDKTEQELGEAIEMRQRLEGVKGVATGLLLVPLVVLGLALLLKFSGWLFATPAPLLRCLTAASAGLLPLALSRLAWSACALRQGPLDGATLAGLLPSSLAAWLPRVGPPPWPAVLGAVDLFVLWSVGLLGLGFAAASGMRRGRALLLAVTGWVVWVGVIQVGLPGLLSGGGR